MTVYSVNVATTTKVDYMGVVMVKDRKDVAQEDTKMILDNYHFDTICVAVKYGFML